MSRTHRGKAMKMNCENGETTLQLAKRILDYENIVIASYYTDALDCLCGELEERYFFHKEYDTIYRLNNNEFNPDDEVIVATRISPVQIEYEVRFYNGGAGFDECIEEAFDKLLKSEED
jgi:hypothetical protein